MAERKPFLLRIDPDLHEALARLAADELRSLNGQIEFMLREALAARGRLPRSAKRSPRPPQDDARGDGRGGSGGGRDGGRDKK